MEAHKAELFDELMEELKDCLDDWAEVAPFDSDAPNELLAEIRAIYAAYHLSECFAWAS